MKYARFEDGANEYVLVMVAEQWQLANRQAADVILSACRQMLEDNLAWRIDENRSIALVLPNEGVNRYPNNSLPALKDADQLDNLNWREFADDPLDTQYWRNKAEELRSLARAGEELPPFHAAFKKPARFGNAVQALTTLADDCARLAEQIDSKVRQ